MQYNDATLKMTSNIKGTPKEKLHQQLGLESLQQRQWYKKLCCFSKFLKINLFKISSKGKFYQQLGLNSINRKHLLTFLKLLHFTVLQLNVEAQFFSVSISLTWILIFARLIFTWINFGYV